MTYPLRRGAPRGLVIGGISKIRPTGGAVDTIAYLAANDGAFQARTESEGFDAGTTPPQVYVTPLGNAAWYDVDMVATVEDASREARWSRTPHGSTLTPATASVGPLALPPGVDRGLVRGGIDYADNEVSTSRRAWTSPSTTSPSRSARVDAHS